MIRLRHLLYLGFGCLTACAQPTTQTMYAAYLEPHTWSYHAHREGLGSIYDGRITMKSKPIDATHSKLEVHLLKDANDPKSGGVQMYWLDFTSFPPRITNSSSTGGNATLKPGFALPNEKVKTGNGQANYAKTQGVLSLKNLAFSWKYITLKPDRLNNRVRFDLEFRSGYKLTDSNIRLELSVRGIERAEWKTSYGTTTSFELEDFQ